MSSMCHVYDNRGLFFDYIASWRLRVSIPKEGLRELGVDSYSGTIPNKDAVNVYHKHFTKEAPEWIKRTGGIYDVVDDNFGLDEYRDHYINMCELAPVITCSTENMKARIKEETGRDAIVVQDPYDPTQYEYTVPEYKDTKSVCWFGSETNLYLLRDMKIPCKGDLVTHAGLQGFAELELQEVLKQGWNYIPWVNGIMPNIFKRHDIAVIPYGDSPKQQAKSPNRIVDALRSGMIVVTNHTPVVYTYGLSDFCIVNPDIDDGIRFVWDCPEYAIEKVKKGQEYIEENLSPKAIAKQWAEVIHAVN